MRALVLVFLAGACAEPAPTGALRGHADGALSVLTYNVNFERPSDETVRAIVAADADLVLLQETHARWERMIRDALGPERYPHVLFRHAEAEGGLAILSRYPLEERRYGRAPDGAFPAWSGRVSAPFGELTVLHVHLHPPLDEEGRLVTGFFTTGPKRLAELRHHLAEGSAPDLVAGDFNEGDGDAIAHLRSLGLRDAQEAHPPLERTWSWDTPWTELEGRPDHVFAGPRLAIRGVHVMQTGASDHRPLRVYLAPRPSAEPVR